MPISYYVPPGWGEPDPTTDLLAAILDLIRARDAGVEPDAEELLRSPANVLGSERTSTEELDYRFAVVMGRLFGRLPPNPTYGDLAHQVRRAIGATSLAAPAARRRA